MIRVLRSPWYSEFKSLVKGCDNRLRVATPFVKTAAVKALYSSKQSRVSVSFLNSIKLAHFVRKSSDIEALRLIVENGGLLRNVNRLHAKIYIFDDNKAIVTSSNLTNAGLKHNFEYGVFLDCEPAIGDLIKDFENLKNEAGRNVSLDNIETVERIIDDVPLEKKTALPKLDFLDVDRNRQKINLDDADVFDAGIESIRNNLTGWQGSVYDCLCKIPDQMFALDSIYSFVPYLSRIYPRNQNIEAKIRQILQQLRDVGLIEFFSPGIYRKLWLEE